MEKRYVCEGYGWPAPRHPAPNTEENGSNTAVDRPESSNKHDEHTSPQQSQSSTSYDHRGWLGNHSQPGVDRDDGDAEYSRYQSTSNSAPRGLFGNVLLARSEPRPQAQSSSRTVPQQSPAWPRPLGYNNTGANFGPSFGDSVPQSTSWLYTQQNMPYQLNQSQEWYESEWQDQRNDHSGQYPSYPFY